MTDEFNRAVDAYYEERSGVNAPDSEEGEPTGPQRGDPCPKGCGGKLEVYCDFGPGTGEMACDKCGEDPY